VEFARLGTYENYIVIAGKEDDGLHDSVVI
jgi:hypothetical protein